MFKTVLIAVLVMLFDGPTTMTEAVKALLAKDIMPTALDTDGLRALDASLRAQSLFSAETLSTGLLERYRDLLTSILSPAATGEGEERPAFNPTYARAEIKKFLDDMGYSPDPDIAGTIKDLSTDARINLVVETNRDMAQGQGKWIADQDETILDQWPAQELFRAEARKVPRDWISRWRLAGGQTGDAIGTGWTITEDGRLIALKNHDIWNLIGSSDLFSDGLDQPWPPFAFQSGMWVQDIDRDEAESLGLITADGKVEPMDVEEVLAKQDEGLIADS